MTEPPVLATELVPMHALHEHPENYNRGDDEAVASLLKRFGQWRPAVVQSSTGYVLIGNTMLRASRDLLGWSHLNVHFRDVDDDEAKRILVADNRSRDLSSTDEAALVSLLASLDGDLSDTLWEPDDFSDLLAAVTPPELDDLLGSYGEPTDDDGLTRVAFRVPADLLVLWRQAVAATGLTGDEAAAVIVTTVHGVLCPPGEQDP